MTDGDLATLQIWRDGRVLIALRYRDYDVEELTLVSMVAAAAEDAFATEEPDPEVVEDAEQMADAVDPPNEQPEESARVDPAPSVEMAPPVSQPVQPVASLSEPDPMEVPAPVAQAEEGGVQHRLDPPPSTPSNGSALFHCPHCTHETMTANGLKTHIGRMHKEQRAKAELAGESFKPGIPPPTVIRAKDGPFTHGPHYCFRCQKDLPSGAALAEHRRTDAHRLRAPA